MKLISSWFYAWILLLSKLDLNLTLDFSKCLPFFYTSPECEDRPDGYNCDCGAGFKWNSVTCVSEGVDSKMTFINNSTGSFAYAILQRKELPPTFTLAAWIRPLDSGTLVSLNRDHPIYNNYMRIQLVSDRGGHLKLKFELAELEYVLNTIIYKGEWIHLFWLQTFLSRSKNEFKWSLYINGTNKQEEFFTSKIKLERVRGELILGQSSRDNNNELNIGLAFKGDIAHFNLWEKTQNVTQIYNDCSLMFCGDLVQWSDFRFGTRGSLQLKWPSGIIRRSCQSDINLDKTCDFHCSGEIGSQCNAEIMENIPWPRTKALNTSYVTCPGQENKPNSKCASRYCDKNKQEGEWAIPVVDNCISASHQELIGQRKIVLQKATECRLSVHDMKELFFILNNLTEHTYSNPVDIGIIVETIEQLTVSWRDLDARCGGRGSTNHFTKISAADIRYFTEALINVTNNLLMERNEVAWNATRPPGAEAQKLTQVLDQAYSNIMINLRFLLTKKTISQSEAHLFYAKQNVVFKLKIYNFRDFSGEALPDKTDLANSPPHLYIDSFGTLAIPWDAYLYNTNFSQSISRSPEKIGVVTAMYPNLSRYMPKIRSKRDVMYGKTGSVSRAEDHVNTAIFHFKLFFDGKDAKSNINPPIRSKFYFLNNHNISEIKCVSYSLHKVKKPPKRQLAKDNFDTWNTDACWLQVSDKDSGLCSCQEAGLLAITTHMFDIHWKRGEKPNPLLQFPSYIGCTMSAVLCFVSCIMLTYMRTYSNTASIHRNFSISIVGGQLAYMFGIDKFNQTLVCKIFAVVLHYFFLASFSWLMNEAFNLYIVITYAAHSHDHTEGGMWRYYLLGWIMPGILVSAFVGANFDNYYAPKMCWIRWEHIWLFVGPAISIIAITILVLVFTAKEHHESSYTKNEKANKAIVIQTKALWTQVILLSIAWSFAFLSVKMAGIIIKCLYSMFNCLQGIFFIVFYFLLNEEVQSIHNDKHKRLSTILNDELSPEQMPLDPISPTIEANGEEVSSDELSKSPPPEDASLKKEHHLPKLQIPTRSSKKTTKSSKKKGQKEKDDDSGYELVTSV